MTVRPIILVGTGAYAANSPRKLACDRLVAELQPQCHVARVPLQVRVDGTGSTECWLELLRQATETDCTHAVYLPDDVHLVPHFVEVLKDAIAARPEEIICCLSNHVDAQKAHDEGARWYTTSDGYVGFAGTMPMPLVREFLAWREQRFADGYPGDASVNLFAILKRKRIWKPLPSLVQHDLDIPSTVGNDWQNSDPRAAVLRSSQVWDPEADLRGVDWYQPDVPLDCTFEGQVWDVVRRLPPEDWDVDAMYQAYNPVPRDGKMRVAIIVPTYGASADVLQETNPSRHAVAADLEAHGIECEIIQGSGDSHVDRMRQSMTHEALKTGCTHMLWWDADISCDNPTTVRAMLTTGHDVIAGACPFKRPGGEVVHNLHEETLAKLEAARKGEGSATLGLERGCIEVRDAGTGFMLVSRRALVRMMTAYKHLCYLSRNPSTFAEPLWALYDGTVGGDPMNLWERDFWSEDWAFCRLWQQLGEKVYVFVQATFAHWGLFPYRGSFAQHHGLKLAQSTEAP